MNYTWNLNPDVRTRDTIIFGSFDKDAYKFGGTRRYDGLTLEKLEQLRDANFLNPAECQNFAPSITEIMEFMAENEGFTAHGYVVSPDRCDYRVSIEGVEKSENITPEDMDAFLEKFRDADEFDFSNEYLFCWYD